MLGESLSGLQKLAVSHFCKRRIPEIQSLHADEYVDPLERNAVQMNVCDSQTTALYPRRGIAEISFECQALVKSV